MSLNHHLPAERIDMGGYTLIENALAGPPQHPARGRHVPRCWPRSAMPASCPSCSPSRPCASGPLLVLGEGSNVLFTGDFDGTVLAMATRGVQVESDGDSARIAVAAGERWDDFVRWTLGQGYAGLENLILIPGTVGAAPIQNIGAYGCEVAEFIESVEAWDTREQRVVTLDHATCAFAYRDSLFKREPGRYIVTAVRFVLPRSRPLRTDYAGIARRAGAHGRGQARAVPRGRGGGAPAHAQAARPGGDRQRRQLLQESDRRRRHGRGAQARTSRAGRLAAARRPHASSPPPG